MPPDENIWKHSNSNSIFSNVSRVGLRARVTTIVLCKTIAVVSSRIKLVAQGADGANLALIHASSRCRRKDCDISLDGESASPTGIVQSELLPKHYVQARRRWSELVHLVALGDSF